MFGSVRHAEYRCGLMIDCAGNAESGVETVEDFGVLPFFFCLSLGRRCARNAAVTVARPVALVPMCASFNGF